MYQTRKPPMLDATRRKAVVARGTPGGGGLLLTTVTLNDAVPVLPWASVAEQFTMVLPTGNREPEDGAHVA